MFGRKKEDKGAAAKKTAEEGKKEEGRKDILKFIKLAINTEKRGIKFYTQAKRRVDDINMNRLLDVILEQEHTHLKFFTHIYNAEKKRGESAAAKEAARYKGQHKLKNPLFGMKQLHDVTKKKSTIYHLFKQAVEFEQDGHDLYMDIARKVKDKRIKNFLRMVAHEELKHRDLILMHQDAVYNTGYWMGMEHVRLET
jgi:rubrerythrin